MKKTYKLIKSKRQNELPRPRHRLFGNDFAFRCLKNYLTKRESDPDNFAILEVYCYGEQIFNTT